MLADAPPTDVNVTNPEPLTVTNVNTEPRDVRIVGQKDSDVQVKARSVAALVQSDADILATEGQRAINRLWERTQAIIAISIVECTLIIVAVIIVVPLVKGSVDETSTTAAVTGLVLLSNLVGNVTGSYFTRTNHSKVGGVAVSGPIRRGE